ncbi:biotin-dependent carboxyltransferase family protein [Tropicimonas sp.]|uniref:5-oxoprolinase subunit C family protein n=1 Tax=Tropicimonas sp. TaxID=2067044 RepID=UPI003A885F04
MSRALVVRSTGPGVSVQDMGRGGFLSAGLSRGGAADPVALAEGAALLSQPAALAALEIAGVAVEVEPTAPLWIALTGAEMRARAGDRHLIWNACHPLLPGEIVHLTPVAAGTYSYLHPGGGIDTPLLVGARGAHLAAGLGAMVTSGAWLPVGVDPHPARQALRLPPDSRFDGGTIRLLRGPQSRLFSQSTRVRFVATRFFRSVRGNRQGVQLDFSGEGFSPATGLQLLSEVVVPGDVQITGDGTPYVLGPECQTIGGYPRIGTVIPQDLPRVLQAAPGAGLRFEFVSMEDALAGRVTAEAMVRALQRKLHPLIRDPKQIADLLSYDLISGVTTGRELSGPEDIR